MKRFVVFLYLFMSQHAIANNMTCGSTRYIGVYKINTYTCSAGQFLPANTEGCVSCPTGAICPGGTYTFNDSDYQGIDIDRLLGTANNMCANNFYHAMFAVYERNTYTCSAGYYLPANDDGCVICPADSYCPGGTYTFNETTAQGITVCSAGLYSPAGAKESAQCGRILHIGDEVLYLRASKITDHALHVDVDHDGVADYFGNMTTADVVMHAGSERKLKVKMNGIIYSIYDDTVTISE